MRVTYNWLKQYIDLSDITPEQVAETMTRCGLEVEGSERMAYGTDLIIGHVLECEMHPDSDHLHVCKVDVGGEEPYQIVCGAPNVAKGQKVIVALPGCKLPGGEIKKGVIRGVESNGMICALFELGVDRKQLTEQQLSGIEVLPEDAEIGNRKVLEYLGLDDTIYDVGLTPNRADCLAMWSLAKEVGACLNKEVHLPDYSYETDEIPADLRITSSTPKCPLFEGKVINEVTIKPSPKWMQDALHAAGVKAINNVVDISNYVMLETGQPLHFYDLAKIPLRSIEVVDNLDETYTALDGIEYKIEPSDIMIATGGKAIGIAGIMGGDDSKIDEETRGIIIEAATFNSVSIRNTARRLGLDTEASQHFIKGIDPLGGHKAVERSVQLLIELADARGIEETVYCGTNSYVPVELTASVDQINRHLATSFSRDQVNDVFRRLDFQPEVLNDDEIRVHIPSYRTDITVWQDLSEEVIRILGYDNIVSSLPLMPTIQGGLSEIGKKKRVIQKMMNGYGFSEILSYSLVSTAKINEGILSCGTPVEISNAVSEERRFYRTSLLPSMLEVVSYNVARSNDEYALFEIANVYNNDNVEEKHLSIALSSRTTVSPWKKEIRNNDFYTMKGIILSVLDKLGYDAKRIRIAAPQETNTVLHPYQSADIFLGKDLIGRFGVIHPACQKKYDIDKAVLAEINLTAIYAQKPSKVKFEAVNRFPSVSYDLAMIVDEEVTGEKITSVIKKAAGSLLKDVSIFDVYRGVNIPAGKKSVAVKLVFESREKTLAENDVRPALTEVNAQLARAVSAVIRDS